MVVAIDGPAASGKSSTASWVASRLGYRHVDSGALYRAVTLLAVRQLGDGTEWDEDAVRRLSARVGLRAIEGGFAPTIDGEEAGDEIRGSDVTRHVSRVAQMPSIRRWVNDSVRASAASHDVVVDGRDIGTVVFPDAPLKVFLVADPWERARRRLQQRLERRPSDDEIAEETERLVQRDARDATQTVQAKDAVLIDTTYLTQSEQVDRIVALARAHERGLASGGIPLATPAAGMESVRGGAVEGAAEGGRAAAREASRDDGRGVSDAGTGTSPRDAVDDGSPVG